MLWDQEPTYFRHRYLTNKAGLSESCIGGGHRCQRFVFATMRRFPSSGTKGMIPSTRLGDACAEIYCLSKSETKHNP